MQEEPQKMLPKLSQEMLAEMIGSTRSRVNFFMAKFRRLGFIGYDGGLHINPSLLSVVLHE
jgi:CRP/FNR family cyclic AMP-dependent transcriptional regulator